MHVIKANETTTESVEMTKEIKSCLKKTSDYDEDHIKKQVRFAPYHKGEKVTTKSENIALRDYYLYAVQNEDSMQDP